MNYADMIRVLCGVTLPAAADVERAGSAIRRHSLADDQEGHEWKVCNVCGIAKPHSAYYFRRSGSPLSACKDCHRHACLKSKKKARETKRETNAGHRPN